MTTYRRELVGAVTAAAGKPIRGVLCTSGLQADGLALNMRGCRLERYRSNPVLLLNHDHQKLPIGQVADITVFDDRIEGRLDFDDDDEAQRIERRVRKGTVRGLSIGFETHGRPGPRGQVDDWTLTETSLVGVPMDQKALIFARAYRGGRGSTVDGAAARALLGALNLQPDDEVRRLVRQALPVAIARLIMADIVRRQR